jgi:hypothetical protein
MKENINFVHLGNLNIVVLCRKLVRLFKRSPLSGKRISCLGENKAPGRVWNWFVGISLIFNTY